MANNGSRGPRGPYGFDQEENERLRRENQTLEEKVKKLTRDLKAALEKLEKWMGVVKKLKEPPNDYAVFVRPHPGGKPDEIDVLLHGHMVKVNLVIEGMTANDLKCGWEVVVNANGQVIEVTKDYWHWGESVAFRERLSDDLALVVANDGGAVKQCFISPELKDVQLKEGDLLLDCHGLLVRALPKTEEKEHFKDVEEISEYNWSRVGGLSKALKQINRVLTTFKEAEVYKNVFGGKKLDVGMILHGPPGCGKTLVAKCIAADLGRHRGLKCYFMPIVGAELSNKYVGETSRKIREVFERAKERAGKDAMVLIFIDEMDSLFRSRSSSSMEHEPWQAEHIGQFCAILDGMDNLGNIFIIGASNHKHLIDAAILRAGRLGKDIRIFRPQDPGPVAEVLGIYLTATLPFAKKYLESDVYEYVDTYGDGKPKQVELGKDREKIRQHFINLLVKRLLYTGPELKLKDEDGKSMKVTNDFTILTENGKERKHLKDFLSGAGLASIVETAKELALARYIKAKEAGENPEPDIRMQDFYRAVDEELRRTKYSFPRPEKDHPLGFMPEK